MWPSGSAKSRPGGRGVSGACGKRLGTVRLHRSRWARALEPPAYVGGGLMRSPQAHQTRAAGQEQHGDQGGVRRAGSPSLPGT